jgi:serine/threonine-protein kinase RsbW
VALPLQLAVRRAQREGLLVELSLDVPSDLALVGAAVDLIAGQCHCGPLSRRRVQFNLRTALAEVLANAIRYGNALDPAKVVRIRVAVTADAVELRVSDEGGGFDPTRQPDPTTPENLEREDGRGLFVIRHLVDQVTFNERGNAVCLTLRAP